MTMRAFQLSTLFLAALSLTVMAVIPAAAQEFTEDECYPLTLEECVEVGGVREERPPVAPAPAEDADVAGDQDERGAPAPDDVAAEAAALPRTGVETGLALAAAVGLIGAGVYALRRTRAKRV